MVEYLTSDSLSGSTISPSRTTSTMTSGDLGDVSSLSKSTSTTSAPSHSGSLTSPTGSGPTTSGGSTGHPASPDRPRTVTHVSPSGGQLQNQELQEGGPPKQPGAHHQPMDPVSQVKSCQVTPEGQMSRPLSAISDVHTPAMPNIMHLSEIHGESMGLPMTSRTPSFTAERSGNSHTDGHVESPDYNYPSAAQPV